MTTIATSSTPELAVPKPGRMVVGVVLFAGFIGFFVLLAVYNLCHGQAIVPSVIWLLLMGGMLFGSCKERGARHVVIKVLGEFARKEFVWAMGRPGGPSEIHFGYRIFGRSFTYLTVGAEKIESVSWSPGQATSIAKRDMNDWSVHVWFDHGDPVKSEKRKKFRKPDQEVYIVGPSGRKEDIAVFGRALVTFLQGAGASLEQEYECGFVRDR